MIAAHPNQEQIDQIAKDLAPNVVREGLAWWFARYAPNDETLAALESQAKAGRLELWADPQPEPPWEFRKAQSALVSN